MNTEFELAKIELGEEEYNNRYCTKFNKPVLNFVETLVFNLPNPCYCDCPYCIDAELRRRQISETNWLKIAKIMIRNFLSIKNVTITGGTVSPNIMESLLMSLASFHPNATITWNTNGVDTGINAYAIKRIKHINLHRCSLDDTENAKKLGYWSRFYPLLDLEEAKNVFDDKLSIRTIIDDDFDLNYWTEPKIPLFLNRQLPVTYKSNKNFLKIMDQIDKIDNSERRRNNQYYDGMHNGVPIRIGIGDNSYEHIPGREPVYLNVAILHRSGIIAGTWYEDDKVLFKP